MDNKVIVRDLDTSDDEHGDVTAPDVSVKDNGGHRDFIMHNDVWVTDRFHISGFLGRGKFGEVKKCTQVDSGLSFAAKFIATPTQQERRDVEHEIAIMRKLRHRLILQLFSAYTSKTEMCLILELVSGGELFERIIDDDFILTERACICFMRQTCKAMEYIHSRNIVHLDMKPENILCLTRTGTRIKIIDFGLAREVEHGRELRVMFGTPEFMAPEVVNYDTVDFTTDMWSVGVICYVLLSGLSPFMGKNDAETLTNVIKGNYSFQFDEYNDISEDAKDLISNLLLRDKRKRLTATQCLQHRWLKLSAEDVSPTLQLSKKRLKRFVMRRKWQKVFHAIIALKRMGVPPSKLLRNDRIIANGLPGKSELTEQYFNETLGDLIKQDKSSRDTPLSYKRKRLHGGSSSSHSRSPQSNNASSDSTASESASPMSSPSATKISSPQIAEHQLAAKHQLAEQPVEQLLDKKLHKLAARQEVHGTPCTNTSKLATTAHPKQVQVGNKHDGLSSKRGKFLATTLPRPEDQTKTKDKHNPMKSLVDGLNHVKAKHIDDSNVSKQLNQNVKLQSKDCGKQQLKPVAKQPDKQTNTQPLPLATDRAADIDQSSGKIKDGKVTVHDNNWLSSKTNFIRLKLKETFL